MIVIARDLKHMFPWEIWVFPQGWYIVLKGRCLLPRELEPFLKENSLLFEKAVFFIIELFLFDGKLVWDWHIVFFRLGKLLLKSN
jgi:hypothetical protein